MVVAAGIVLALAAESAAAGADCIGEGRAAAVDTAIGVVDSTKPGAAVRIQQDKTVAVAVKSCGYVCRMVDAHSVGWCSAIAGGVVTETEGVQGRVGVLRRGKREEWIRAMSFGDCRWLRTKNKAEREGKSRVPVTSRRYCS